MKEYLACFLGIPLPQGNHSEFGRLLVDIKKIDPNLTVEDPSKLVPHLTIHYLGKQSEEAVSQIAEITEDHTSLLQGVRLKISKLGFFRENDPRVIYLKVKYPSVLCDFNELVVKDLAPFISGEESLPFHPHMTVARMRTEAAQASFARKKLQLEERLDRISWDFPITEAVLFGVDPQDKQKIHQRLITMPIGK